MGWLELLFQNGNRHLRLTILLEHFISDICRNRPTLVPFVMDLNRKAGYKDGIFVRPAIDPFFQYRHWYTYLEEIGLAIAETFGDSESAGYVHMKC